LCGTRSEFSGHASHSSEGFFFQDTDMSYTIEPRDRYFQVLCSLPEREIRPGPTVTFSSLVDLTQVEAVRAAAKHGENRKYSYTAFVVKALALALKDYPYANRRVFRRLWLPLVGPRLQKFHACDVAVAVERDLPGRESVAFVDVLRDADRRSLTEIMDQLVALSESDAVNNKQWREFSTLIRRFPYWMASFLVRLPCWFPGMWVKYRGAATLVTSPAKYGGLDNITASWAWPVGVSFGTVKHRPVVYDGQVLGRPTFNLVLNFDRRVMAGAQAAQFFKRLVDILEGAEKSMAPFLPRA
jgi:pyruvate/2-oxoglutarate dehydrogenase complex dihydrolipoamide acyltransferase (E2) component